MLYFFFLDNNLINFYNLFMFDILINKFLFNTINLNIFYYSLFYYNYILIVLMIYTTYYNKYLLLEFRYFIIYISKSINKFIKNIGSSSYENFNYTAMGLVKHIFLKLLIRLIEINKEEERYKYRKINISWQFIDFFYIKIVFNYFYGLFFRFIYFVFFFYIKKYLFYF